jgi:hypothetical protein
MKKTIKKISRCRYWNCPNNHKKENDDRYFVMLCKDRIKECDIIINSGDYFDIVAFILDSS